MLSRDSRDFTNRKIFVTSPDVPAGKGNPVNAVNPVNVGGTTKVDPELQVKDEDGDLAPDLRA